MRLALIFLLAYFSALSGFGQSTNTTNPLDYAAFKIIPERNIFNPNRIARGSGPPRTEQKAAKIDSFALVGTMSYEKGNFAFFDGSSSEFRKVLSPSNSIAGYTLVNIEENGVKLEKDGKAIDLPVGSQMKREDQGEWTVSAGTGITSATNSDSASAQGPGTAGSSGESDVLKRLLEKREKESKK